MATVSAIGIMDADRFPKIAKIPLVGATIDAGAISWQNPEIQAVLVSRVFIDATTIATNAGTISVGTSSTVASSNNLIDTCDLHSATGVFDNITDKGSSGKSRQRVPVGQYVTFATASGYLAGLAGNAYIEFVPV